MKWKTQRAYFVSHWGQPLGLPLIYYMIVYKYVCYSIYYSMYIIVWYAPDRWCRLHHRQITDTEKRKYSLHIPLAESRKVGSERRAVGAVLSAGRAAFRNPKNLIHCLLGFWGPDWAFGCGIPAQKRHFHTRLSCVKVPLSCKISWFCHNFPILIRQNRDLPTLAKSSWWHGKNSRFSLYINVKVNKKQAFLYMKC